MGDYYYSLACGLHVSQDCEKLLRFLRSEYRCRLVQNKNVGASVKHLYYFNSLLLGNGHVVDFLFRIDIKAVGIAYFTNFHRCLFKIQLSLFLESQNDVFGSGKHIHQLEVLMNHSYAVVKGFLRGVNCSGLAVDAYFTLIRIVDS